jgi:uncharacterized protein involved in outer membrane biogenesis
MKKKILIIGIIFFFFLCAGIAYLNAVFLPRVIKNRLASEIKKATNREVTIGTVSFNIFKGLVVKDMVLFEFARPCLTIKEVSCNFLIPSLFKKSIIIPALKIDSPAVTVERKPDGTWNVGDLFAAEPQEAKTQGMMFLVQSVYVRNGRIDFQDNAVSPVFSKKIEKINGQVRFSLPSKVKFKLDASISSLRPMRLHTIGDYDIPRQELTGHLDVLDASLQEFSPYYQQSGIEVREGKVAMTGDVTVSGGWTVVAADMKAQVDKLSFVKDKVVVTGDADISCRLKYDMLTNEADYSGQGVMKGVGVEGVERVGRVNDIRGTVAFDKHGMHSEEITAVAFGIPLKGNFQLTSWNDPLLVLAVRSRIDLGDAQKVLKDSFAVDIPVTLEGKGDVLWEMKSKVIGGEPPEWSGYIDVVDAQVEAPRLAKPVTQVQGRIIYTDKGLQWDGVRFKFDGTDYATTGTMQDLQDPLLTGELKSQDLEVATIVAFTKQQVVVSKCKGRYLHSSFLGKGTIEGIDTGKLRVKGDGLLTVDVSDARRFLPAESKAWEALRPEGVLSVAFVADVDPGDVKSLTARATISGKEVSLLGLKLHDVAVDYVQSEGMIDIPRCSVSLYGGGIDGLARMNLNSERFPYWFSVNVTGVKLEELKADTPVREKNISGTIQGEVKCNGYAQEKNLSRLSGAGKILVSDGNLWQLNLFQGLGQLLFVKDFGNIEFTKAYCGFVIQDEAVKSDNIKLESTLANLTGTCRIGFDSSLVAALNVEVLSDSAPVTGTVKDLTTAIIGQAQRFGVIKVSGTVQDPKYTFHAAIGDILKGLKNSLINTIGQ